MTRVRCAIYTRKSSDEGLDQSFNSLDAQHEACVAYIASQRHEGWRALPNRYDDGGLSGGTLERPALQTLLADIDRGRIDMVVVYKIDRLTRSLADFAKLVERMEAAQCSFVSVTQSFNTSSSMGRLTLNVLLSFAQFEREVTAERIRDKIAASKKKGMWMGGLPPLGYDPHPDKTRRELVVNEAEAQTVRRLFALYLEAGCLNATARDAASEHLRSKRRVFASGRVQGGTALSRGQIHATLTNPVYRGFIRHKDKVWPAKHPALVEAALWDQVQAMLQAASGRRRGQAGLAAPGAMLLGKFRDQSGARLTPTHTQRHGRMFRYYVSHGLITGARDAEAWRLPARAFEAAVTQVIQRHLTTQAEHRALRGGSAAEMERAGQAMLDRLARARPQDLAALIEQGAIAPGRIRITLDRTALASWCDHAPEGIAPQVLAIDTSFTTKVRGVETRIVAGALHPDPDPTLLKALRNAHRWKDAMLTGASIKKIAQGEGCSEGYVRRILPLATLAPKIQGVIVAGTQPADLTLERLVRARLPLNWTDQDALLLP